MDQRLEKDGEMLIDAMRGIAALLVLFTHAFDLAAAEAYGWAYASNPESWRWARASLGHGGFLVWCFFLISGVCIHQSISRSIRAGTFSWKQYAVARVTRIYPLFLLGLGLAVLTWFFHEDFGEGYNPDPWIQFFSSLFSLQILTSPFPAYETSWSLSCEMMYYAAWPVALLLARGRATPAAGLAILGVVGSLVGIMLTWRWLHKLEHSTFVEGVWIITALFPVWICGAWLGDNWGKVSAFVTRRLWAFSIFLCLLSECLLVWLKFTEAPPWAVHLAGLSSIPGLMLFVAGARHTRLSSRGWAGPVCSWLGQFSYPCYILHMQLLLLVDHLVDCYAEGFAHKHPVWHTVVEFAVVLAVLVVIGPRLEKATMLWRTGILRGLKKSQTALT